MVMARDFVVRRSELTVPGHSLKMMTKAVATNADQVMFDLEDACAVSQKIEARKTVIEAFNTLDFHGKIRAFRPNNIFTRFFYRDLIDVVESTGQKMSFLLIVCLARLKRIWA
jgi:citrate lyase subunit beta/citryl-CoA lyase